MSQDDYRSDDLVNVSRQYHLRRQSAQRFSSLQYSFGSTRKPKSKRKSLNLTSNLTSDHLSDPLVQSQDEQKKSRCNWEKDITAVKKLIFGSYLNVLMILVPFGFISNYLDWNETLTFFINFFAMIPIASVLGDATECLAEHLGETIGGLLNATFGNAVEIVVMILALIKARHYKDNDNDESLGKMIVVVQMSLIGSIFSNALLVLGCAFVANGFIVPESQFNKTASSANVSLLMVAAFVMILPSPYASSTQGGDGKQNDELMVSRAAAIILLIMYMCLLIFVLVTHKDLMDPESGDKKESTSNHEKQEIRVKSYTDYIDKLPSKKEFSTDSIPEDNEIQDKIQNKEDKDNSPHVISGLLNVQQNSDVLVKHSEEEKEEEEDELDMSLFGSMTLLFVATIIVAVLSEFVVDSIEPMADNTGMSEAFVGLILLPIIGNAVEHITAIRMAIKNKMDISLSIAIGSATQVAMFVVGLAVIVGWILEVPMKLDFDTFEVNLFIYTSIIIFALVSDGSSNWLEGAMLLALYVLIAIAVWDQKFDYVDYA